MPVPFHERLEALAKKRGVSALELGTRVGLSSDTVNKWIRLSKENEGKISGRSEVHGKLARHWRVSTEWLLGISDRGGPDEIIELGADARRDDDLADKVVEILQPRGYRATRVIAATAAARVYERELERESATTIERLAELAAGLIDADDAFGSRRPSSSPGGPTGPSTRHKIRRAGSK
jgi:transcriptional regulator with XRE-family HTH domain